MNALDVSAIISCWPYGGSTALNARLQNPEPRGANQFRWVDRAVAGLLLSGSQELADHLWQAVEITEQISHPATLGPIGTRGIPLGVELRFKTADSREAILEKAVRPVLNDDQWQRIETLCKGRAADPGGTGANNRMFVEAVLWIARTDAPWRDLPGAFGNWNSVFVRFNRWSAKGV